MFSIQFLPFDHNVEVNDKGIYIQNFGFFPTKNLDSSIYINSDAKMTDQIWYSMILWFYIYNCIIKFTESTLMQKLPKNISTTNSGIKQVNILLCKPYIRTTVLLNYYDSVYTRTVQLIHQKRKEKF